HEILTTRKAFTLVEMLISLALLAVLFTLLGSMLHGMSRLSRLAEDSSLRDRQISFCFDLIRKELGEMVVIQNQGDYSFISGENFVAYTTTRSELLARNSIPGGVKRVEWRHDPGTGNLVRTVSMLVDGKREAGEPSRTRFFENLDGLEVYIFDGVEWLRMTGISEAMPQTQSIALRLIFKSAPGEKNEFFESAFILPNETFNKE
ncbi:MAG: prepilin-type N-terminal cleavage/methylation domain-containing protein, partial [Candidatus Rifleibacteriota bacterium]